MARKGWALAGIIVLNAFASARITDGTVTIDRAIDSPTLTVKYTGATVALVEFKLNGESLGTRSITSTKTAGETNFTLDLSRLADGDNKLEVLLFDKAGKLAGRQTANIASNESGQSAVFLSSPKLGSTVQGPVNLVVGFGKELKNSYVSFFIDNKFKSMSNVPPFEYLWDSSRDTNGWHMLQALVVDDTSTTFKTREVKVFVDNPSGRTDRPEARIVSKPATKPVSKPVIKAATKPDKRMATAAAVVVKRNPILGAESANPEMALLGSGTVGVKPSKLARGVATGTRFLLPTGARIGVSPKLAAVIPTVAKAPTHVAAHTIAIGRGTRLPNMGAFAISFNQENMAFDVAPRVEDGVPLAPLRHLLEKAGGKVNWENFTKTVNATAEGRDIFIQIGDKTAKIDHKDVQLEVAPYIENGRTIVPLSFIQEMLHVNIQYDPATGHVLITSIK